MLSHVKSVRDDTKSWCGKTLNQNVFYFKGVDQAVLNGLHETKVFTCHECANEIIEALIKGINK